MERRCLRTEELEALQTMVRQAMEDGGGSTVRLSAMQRLFQQHVRERPIHRTESSHLFKLLAYVFGCSPDPGDYDRWILAPECVRLVRF